MQKVFFLCFDPFFPTLGVLIDHDHFILIHQKMVRAKKVFRKYVVTFNSSGKFVDIVLKGGCEDEVNLKSMNC